MKKLFFLFLFCLTCSPAQANDTAGYVLPTGGVVFQKQDGIRMVTEALYIRPGQIEVNYLFENTTNKDITTQVFFPLPPISAVDDYYKYYRDAVHLFNFKLWVNGKSINYQTAFNLKQGERDVPSFANALWKSPEETLDEPLFHQRVSAMDEKERKNLIDEKFLRWGGIFLPNKETGKNEEAEGWTITSQEEYLWTKEISYYWEQTFPAGKTVHIRHTYTPSYKTTNTGRPFSRCIDQESSEYHYFISDISKHEKEDRYIVKDLKAENYLEYILTTANNWQKSIANFNLLIESPLKSLGCFEKKPFFADKYFAVNTQNFSPKGDLALDFIDKSNNYTEYEPVSLPALYRVDGPANVHQAPKGQTIGQMENNTYVWVWPENKKDKWYPFLQNDLKGYTHEKNLIKVF